MKQSVLRMNSAGVWPRPVMGFLTDPTTLEWLESVKMATGKSDDETVLLLLCAMRYLKLEVTDGAEDAAALISFLQNHSGALKELCQTKKVQANIPERALPIAEVLARRWGDRPLEVLELGCSFGLIGRALTSLVPVMENFPRYFDPVQQRPEALPSVASYRGWDLSPPDPQWLLACMPLPEVRARTARFMDEIPAGDRCRVQTGSALDLLFFTPPPPGMVPVVLTSFMLYQLPPDLKVQLKEIIRRFVKDFRGSWINLDVIPEPGGTARFVLEEDGVLRLELENDLCRTWRVHGD